MKIDKKILIVDDSVTLTNVLKKELQNFGFSEVVSVNDVPQAMIAIENNYQAAKPFDLVLSDWTMPGQTGADLLRWIRLDDRFKTLPFVLVTAQTKKEIILGIINDGANGYLFKPLDPVRLKSVVMRALGLGK